MGFFDFLRKSSPPPAGSAAPSDKKVAGPARVAADKRAQTYDRLEALQQLAEMKTAESAAALLKRFSFSIDPSITTKKSTLRSPRVYSAVPLAIASSRP